MSYIIVREGTTTPVPNGSKPPRVFTDKAKADETCERYNGSLDPPGSPKPDPPYVVIEKT